MIYLWISGVKVQIMIKIFQENQHLNFQISWLAVTSLVCYLDVMGRCGATIQNWFLAIEKGDLSLVQKLWKDISDIDVTDTYILNNIKHDNVTGLIIGAHFGHKDVVKWLLKNKANVNWETNLKWRPIHFAAKRGHCTTVDMLCNSGALVDPLTMNNETPLSLALQSHMRDTVLKLVHLGAQTNKSNESLVYHYVCRGMLVPDNSSQTQRENVDTALDGSLQLRNQSPQPIHYQYQMPVLLYA
uniref:ANK_REP_REGION domain-containing protein n=1 Tax=Trichobilharzia regenti TaxID=157069 RepID=A0AA85JF13_TRIRE|nr:unnamed protein product [Trichobilharzia regenti]